MLGYIIRICILELTLQAMFLGPSNNSNFAGAMFLLHYPKLLKMLTFRLRKQLQ
jgi:hypothetical protein